MVMEQGEQIGAGASRRCWRNKTAATTEGVKRMGIMGRRSWEKDSRRTGRTILEHNLTEESFDEKAALHVLPSSRPRFTTHSSFDGS